MFERSFSWVIENRLAGVRGPTGNADLLFLKKNGLSVLVRLAEKGEAEVTAEQLENVGLEDHHVPVKDGTAPSMTELIEITDFVNKRLSEGKAVAVSCHAGIGRTGTVLMCILLSMGNSYVEAEKIMNRAGRSVCETGAQYQAIVNFARFKQEKNKSKTVKSNAIPNQPKESNLDQSVYEPDNPEATQEDDMEEDLALLDDEDDLW